MAAVYEHWRRATPLEKKTTKARNTTGGVLKIEDAHSRNGGRIRRYTSNIKRFWSSRNRLNAVRGIPVVAFAGQRRMASCARTVVAWPWGRRLLLCTRRRRYTLITRGLNSCASCSGSSPGCATGEDNKRYAPPTTGSSMQSHAANHTLVFAPHGMQRCTTSYVLWRPGSKHHSCRWTRRYKVEQSREV